MDIRPEVAIVAAMFMNIIAAQAVAGRSPAPER
jgi:hypothetical protein